MNAGLQLFCPLGSGRLFFENEGSGRVCVTGVYAAIRLLVSPVRVGGPDKRQAWRKPRGVKDNLAETLRARIEG